MSLSTEALAFLGKAVAPPKGRSVRLLTAGEDLEAGDFVRVDEAKLAKNAAAGIPTIPVFLEDTMHKTADPAKPKRKYTRRIPPGTPVEIEGVGKFTAGKAKTRKPRQEKPSGVIFSVDSTGALLIRRGDYGMEFSREEVLELKQFMQRAETMWSAE